MRTKSVTLSLIALVILIGVTYLLYTDETQNVNKAEVPRLEAQSKSDYDKIAIRKGERLIVMNKVEENRWELEGETAFPVGETAIKSALDKLAKLSLAESISQSPSDLSIYELDDENAVEVTASKGSTPLRHVKLGKTGGGYSATFIQMVGDDAVYLSKTSLRSVFDRDDDAWKDKVALKIDRDDVQRIVMIPPPDPEGADASFAFSQYDVAPPPPEEGEAPDPDAQPKKEWVMEEENVPVDQSKVRSLLSSLSNLRATDIVSDLAPEKSGFDAPWMTVKLEMKDGTMREIALGEVASEGGNRYLKVEDKPYFYILSKTLVEKIGLFRQTYLVQQSPEWEKKYADSPEGEPGSEN